MSDENKCELCGEPMPAGEEMFKFHGYSGPCPKPPLPRDNGAEEVTEQARLLGISAEKELALMAKMDQLKKELATAQEHIRDLEAVRQNDIDEFNILSEQLAAALVACAAKPSPSSPTPPHSRRTTMR